MPTKTNYRHKIVSIIVAVVLVLSVLPFSVFATEIEETEEKEIITENTSENNKGLGGSGKATNQSTYANMNTLPLPTPR